MGKEGDNLLFDTDILYQVSIAEVTERPYVGTPFGEPWTVKATSPFLRRSMLLNKPVITPLKLAGKHL